jgi:predicted kinase
MISLKSLLLEVYGGPKAIIMSGAAGMGKSSLLDALGEYIPSNFKIFNPDTFNPEDDPKKPNITKNSATIRKQAIPQAISNKESFIYDTTGQNFQETANIVQAAQQAGYKVMVITLYGSPIVNFLRNFKRDRKLPKDAVLTSWAKVYKNIDDFKKLPNIEYLLVQTELSPEERDEVIEFERAFKGGDLEEYFKNYEVILEIDCWSLINSENKKFVKGDYLEKFKKNYTKQFLNYFLDSFISEKSIEITEKIMSEY